MRSCAELRCCCSGCCPEGWRVLRSSWYLLSDSTKTWSQSWQDCQTRGADLVIINSREKQVWVLTEHLCWGFGEGGGSTKERPIINIFLQEFLNRLGYGLTVWIGLIDLDNEGTWRWVDGSTPSPTYAPDNKLNFFKILNYALNSSVTHLCRIFFATAQLISAFLLVCWPLRCVWQIHTSAFEHSYAFPPCIFYCEFVEYGCSNVTYHSAITLESFQILFFL